MRIAVIGHVRHPIRPPFMGGMEAHSWHLVRGLTRRGHDVTLFASGDSDPAFRIHPVLREHYDRRFPWADHIGSKALNAHVDGGFARAGRDLLEGGFDVVHNNALHRYPPRLARRHRLPMVTSLHVPPFDALDRAVAEGHAPWTRFTVTSARQVESWWPGDVPSGARVVHNGVDLADWPFSPRGDGTVVWSGRITPNKGVHLAVTAARRAGVPLTIYGMIEDRPYFDREVTPYLGRGVTYGGHLAVGELASALGRAGAFLFTPRWDEPFGLAAVEAMATGLPVAATRMGAVEEVIGDQAGRLAEPDDVAGLARALTEALRIDRAVPRARVERHFAIDRMIDGYEALYGEVRAARHDPFPDVAFPPIELRVAPALSTLSVA